MRIDRLRPGDLIDSFRLIEKLHQGGMAVIWSVEMAEGQGPDFPLAMKLPLIDDADDPTLIVGFEVEQMILPTLSGAHAPRFVRNGDFGKQPYIVMELMRGQSLFRLYEGKAPLPIDEVVRIGAKTAEALEVIHRQNVVHLDLKPANLFLRDSGEVAFLDFGLSHSNVLPDLLAEEFKLPLGTGPYMSPEQVLGVRNDRRSDLFALGVMLYEFATGRMPFGEPATWKGMRKRLWRDPEPPRALRPETPEWLQEIILKLLNISPARRYATAGQLAFALKNPDSVTLTPYGQKTRRDGIMQVLRRRMKAASLDFTTEAQGTGGLATAPIIAAAVDLSRESGPLEEAVARAARRVALSEPDARIACLSVLKTKAIGVDFATNDAGESYRLLRLIALKDWARRIDFPAERVTHHVLEGSDPAEELIAFCRNNHVEHLVMGARAASAIRRYLGSVSAQVVAEAPCSVTVVRVPQQAETGETEEAEAIEGMR
ncbi:MAG: protein kinase domain-containing protein [Beijerinckiaceae bacterium]